MHIKNLIKHLEATPPHAKDNAHLLLVTPDGKFYRYDGVTFETPFHNPRVIIRAGAECDAAGVLLVPSTAPDPLSAEDTAKADHAAAVITGQPAAAPSEESAPTPSAPVDSAPAPTPPEKGADQPVPSEADAPSPVTTADTQAQPPDHPHLGDAQPEAGGAPFTEEIPEAPVEESAPASVPTEQKPDAASSAS